MVKVLFAGPSVHGVDRRATDVVRRPPASHGDIRDAVLEGVSVIGLVDGLFETQAAVWHKEILFALSRGVTVLGAASMGALRASECRSFGMLAVGEVARRYVEGELDDDAAVAQLHAPAELDFLPLTEALVDCEAQVDALRRAETMAAGEADAVVAAARATFFKDRTWSEVLASAGLSRARSAGLLDVLRARKDSLKRADALLLLDAMERLEDRRRLDRPAWILSETSAWLRSLAAGSRGPDG